jgi:hypothetical protein
VQIRSPSLTGSYVMATAEQREPYESRGSRTVLGEPGGESPPGHSTADLRAAKILVTLVVLPDQKSPIIAVRLGFIRRMPELRRAQPDRAGQCS